MISDSIDVSVGAIAYYLYRQIKCPYGDNLSGFEAWLDIQKEAFQKLANTDGEDDATS